MPFTGPEKMDSEETFWDPLLKCAILSLIKEDIKAKKYLLKLLKTEPDTPKKIHRMLSSLILTEDLVMEIVNAVERIGLVQNV
jgi:hypothetical protein